MNSYLNSLFSVCRCRRWLELFILIIALFHAPLYAIEVFPGAQGFGTQTPAGRGGAVYRVTNLNASGPKSFDECLRAAGPRVCVFEVSGTIQLSNSELAIRNPFVTVAGQTAPEPGITIRGGGIRIFTHDVLIQHIKVRVGDDPGGIPFGNRDGIGIESGSQNVVIDHCSISWAIDENVSLWHEGTGNITISNTIISEGLYNSNHPKGAHSMGFLIGPRVKNVSVLRNVLAHNDGRNPLIYGDTSSVLVNNIIYNPNWAGITISGSHGAGPMVSSLVGNILIRGVNTNSAMTTATLNESIAEGSSIYAEDNFCEKWSQDPWSCIAIQTSLNVKSLSPIGILASIKILPRAEVEDAVLAFAGARPVERDSVDQRVISDIQSGTGRYIDSPEDVGGWPAVESQKRILTLPNNPNNDDNSNGYTNLEEWLHTFSDQVEVMSVVTAISPPTPPGGVTAD